ncbi:MAG: Flagellar assembly protein FliH [Betaproteobacteria bacterium ADurb.Bin341]|nr:MAG: Flagellar assembly protein FliH [Betaproteobacteria bacterium ADurb.Bin341]
MPVIPKDKITGFERWKADSFDAGGSAIRAGSPSSASSKNAPATLSGVPLPTAEGVERIHNEARDAGYREGFASGEKAGQKAGLEQLQHEAKRLATLADNFQEALGTLDQDIADAVLELALTIAQQVLQQELQTRPESIIGVVRSTLNSLPMQHGNISIHLHPDDAKLLREQLGNQIAQSGWHLIDDPSVKCGGCQVRTGGSEVDASFSTRWRRVLEALGRSSPSDI